MNVGSWDVLLRPTAWAESLLYTVSGNVCLMKSATAGAAHGCDHVLWLRVCCTQVHILQEIVHCMLQGWPRQLSKHSLMPPGCIAEPTHPPLTASRPRNICGMSRELLLRRNQPQALGNHGTEACRTCCCCVGSSIHRESSKGRSGNNVQRRS